MNDNQQIQSQIDTLREQVAHRFPTRDDVKSALENLQQQLDQRFGCVREVGDTKTDERDKRYEAERIERDKAIEVLATGIRENVRTGDDNLRQHIANQVQQIQAALAAAEALENSRFHSLNSKLDQLNSSGHEMIEARIKGVSSEMAIINAASEKAIQKAEANVKERLDDASKTDANLRQQVNDLMPRHEAIALAAANADKITALTDRINRTEGRGIGLNAGWVILCSFVGLSGGVATMIIILLKH